jgi:hypothetical protein
VWDVLERRVRLNVLYAESRPRGEEYFRELSEVNRLLDEIGDKGTPRDRLIEPLYNAIILQPGGALPIPFEIKKLSLDEFRQLRSKVKQISDNEIREEIRKAHEEFDRKARKKDGGRWSPGGLAKP